MVALSSMEAQYMALTKAVKEVCLLRSQVTKIRVLAYVAKISKIDSNNQGVIALARNFGFHARSKHIDIQYHFILILVG